MALIEGSVEKTIRTVTETSAYETILYRQLIEGINSGGVFPDYPVKIKYATTVFEVNELNQKIGIVEQKNPSEILLTLEEIYPLYLTPVTIQINNELVATVLGDLLCNTVDNIIKQRKLNALIIAHPTSQEVLINSLVYLTVRSACSLECVPVISWYKNGILIPNLITEEIEIQATETAEYQAWLTVPYGISKSNIATITIVEP